MKNVFGMDGIRAENTKKLQKDVNFTMDGSSGKVPSPLTSPYDIRPSSDDNKLGAGTKGTPFAPGKINDNTKTRNRSSSMK